MNKTYTVYINNLNLLASPYVRDAYTELEISEEEYLKTRSFQAHEAWQWFPEEQTFKLVTSPVLDALRDAREFECFAIINRSPLWFMSLSIDQQKELTEWYQAWLDVTETQVVPEAPKWLK